jgi:transcriptional regulator NrdR family protein
MNCPACGELMMASGRAGARRPGTQRVTDCRPTKNGIRRRRECNCGHRFTTLKVVVKDGQRDSEKPAFIERECD